MTVSGYLQYILTILGHTYCMKTTDLRETYFDLWHIWQHDDELGLIKLLPSSGKSGTLKYRRSMRKGPIKGAIVAKSGSVYGSYNMAGFALDEKGKPKSLFVQFITDYHLKKAKSDDKPTIAPIVQFETLFYKDVIKFSQAITKKAE